MITIFKYVFPIEDRFQLTMPEGAMVVLVECQIKQPCLWALIDTDRLSHHYGFGLYGTGHAIPFSMVDARHAHIATFQQPPFVWHLFGDPSLVKGLVK